MAPRMAASGSLLRQHLERMAGGRATLYLSGLERSYRPLTGLAAARMLVRAFSVAYASHPQ